MLVLCEPSLYIIRIYLFEFIGSRDRSAISWDVETQENVMTLSGHDHELTHICAHPSLKFLTTSSRDKTLGYGILKIKYQVYGNYIRSSWYCTI